MIKAKNATILSSALFFSLLLTIFIVSPAKAAVFNPNSIITDGELLDYTSMSLDEIEAFLDGSGGYISTHKFTDAFGQTKTAAEIIYNAATNNFECENIEDYRSWSIAQKEKYCEPVRINPKLLLVLLQKEQSLIDEESPSQKQLDWATGYGICDNCSMDDPSLQRFKGFGKQVNSAALQFYDYVNSPENYGFKAGNTYLISNTGKPSMYVTPANSATAGLYNYTPHVYNGNFNFFKLWMRYFTFNYPNGTLMQVKGESGVWLIQDGKRRAFLSKGALTSRFDANKIVPVSKSDLEKYSIGDPIKYPQYSILRSPRGTVYLLVDDKRRGFTSQEALRKTGINPEEIVDAEWDDLNTYAEGLPITATSSYPTGALLQDKVSGGVFYVSDGTKAPLWDAILLKTKFKFKSITKETPEKLASYKTVEPAIFGDGELIKNKDSAAVYIIDNGKKRLITSGELFVQLGYKWNNVIPVPKKILDLYPDGENLSEIFNADEIETADTDASTTPDVIANETASSSDPEESSTTNLDSDLSQEINDVLNP